MVKLSSIFSDGMIIEKKARIFGTAAPNEIVKICFLGQIYSVAADYSGQFEFVLENKEFGGPYTLTVGEHIINDVYVGVVWYCGGQSNMEMVISRVRHAFESELGEDLPLIRQFTPPYEYDFLSPHTTCKAVWRKAVKENLNDFSAVAYFFAKKLFKKLGVAVGLVSVAVGGSKIEAWMRREALEGFENKLKILQPFLTPGYAENAEQEEIRQMRNWFDLRDREDI